MIVHWKDVINSYFNTTKKFYVNLGTNTKMSILQALKDIGFSQDWVNELDRVLTKQDGN